MLESEPVRYTTAAIPKSASIRVRSSENELWYFSSRSSAPRLWCGRRCAGLSSVRLRRGAPGLHPEAKLGKRLWGGHAERRDRFRTSSGQVVIALRAPQSVSDFSTTAACWRNVTA
jgi:hypothetical protein